MANIIRIKRGQNAPVATLAAGEFAVDQANKNLYLGIADGSGNVTNEIIAGEGTFATKSYVSTAVSSATGSLGTMSTQDADSVAITGGSVNGTTIGATTASSGAFTTLTASSAPSASNDVVRKTDLDSAITALGSVFHFIGDISAATSNDLSTLSDQTTGSYYRVDVAGTYTAGGDSFALKVGDAIVKTSTGWQKLDNVDAEVSGTANEIAVSGDENAGYTVAIDPVFSGRLSTAEGDIDDLENLTQNFVSATAGSTEINGEFWGDAKLSLSGTGTLLDIGGDIVASGTVSGTNITDLETKTQNISLADTSAGNTSIGGTLVVSDNTSDPFNSKTITIGNASVKTYDVSIDSDVTLSSAGVIRNGPSSADFKFETNAGSVLVKAPSGAITLDASVVNVSGDLSGSGTSTLDGFSIDGGVF